MPYKIESKSMTVKSVIESVVEGIIDVLVSPGAGLVAPGELVSAGGGAVHAGELMSPAKAAVQIARVNRAAAQNCLSCFI